MHKTLYFLVVTCFLPTTGVGQESEPDPGHSHQGEAFDQGPRRFAVLEGDTGQIDFQATACTADAQAFINQGIGQLHGFLNYESERSFRHAAYLDPTCAMAFWGIAMANTVWVQNTERALKLIEPARALLTNDSHPREVLYVEAIESLADEDHGPVRYLNTLRQIFIEYPTDLDAKAFFVEEVWQRKLHEEMGFPGETYRDQTLPLDALAREVLEINPLHPVHHYLVHMWDNKDDHQLALTSADTIGFSGPGIAHLWHMAGHIYSQANFTFETWWSQEAAARVDHRYMADKRVLPFMLHNHAHNNEWLTRTLMGLGDFSKALQVSLNLLAQPRHPTFNRIEQYQHQRNGVLRTLNIIERAGYWELSNRLFASPFMRCEQFTAYEDAEQLCLRVGRLTEIKMGSHLNLVGTLKPDFQREIDLYQQILRGESTEAALAELSTLEHLQTHWGLFHLVRYSIAAGDSARAVAQSQRLMSESGHVTMFILQATLAEALAGNFDRAQQLLDQARRVSERVDRSAPVVRQLTAALRTAGLELPQRWLRPFAEWRDVHSDRPELNDLGPLLWQPLTMTNFQWQDSYGETFDFEEITAGRPAVVVLLMSECPHCDQQYALLDEQRANLEAKGIELVAVTSQQENMAVYRQLDAWDDFESIPIHGLYIINQQREIVWQDLAADPFMDIPFIMEEVDRSLHPWQRLFIRGEGPLHPHLP